MQWEAIRALLHEVKKCPEVRAAFLKGSFAQGTADEYSDVDFYCLVDEVHVRDFLDKRLQLLEKYRPLIFHSEADFVGPQIVAVFDNGLHVDLYTVTLSDFPRTGPFRSLHDPDNLLPALMTEMGDHSLSWMHLEKCFDSFSFTLLEFHRAISRGDLVWSLRLASHLVSDLGIVLRHRYDPPFARLGPKRLEVMLPKDVRQSLREALSFCSETSLLEGVLRLTGLMRTAMQYVEDQKHEKTDWRLFEFMVDRLELCLRESGNLFG